MPSWLNPGHSADVHVTWPFPVTTELGASLKAPLPFPPARAGVQSLSPGHGTSVLSVAPLPAASCPWPLSPAASCPWPLSPLPPVRGPSPRCLLSVAPLPAASCPWPLSPCCSLEVQRPASPVPLRP
uniref:Uncharacterized protein n=1 Tax=Myotis myotis TaxID=51298 RepID=A0A7J7XZP6_MYOMY|nr:hypothetical protein mMyoMyo1_011310 [Myotis myotis]